MRTDQRVLQRYPVRDSMPPRERLDLFDKTYLRLYRDDAATAQRRE